MSFVIGISGKRGTGKDTLAAFLNRFGWIHESFARTLKVKVREEFEMSAEQMDDVSLKEVVDPRYNLSPRDILTKVGQFYRKFDDEWWVKKTFARIDKTPGLYAISDVRFQNEAELIIKKGGIVVRLERPQELNIYKGISTDISEVGLDDFPHFAHLLKAEDNRVFKDLENFAGMLNSKYNKG